FAPKAGPSFIIACQLLPGLCRSQGGAWRLEPSRGKKRGMSTMSEPALTPSAPRQASRARPAPAGPGMLLGPGLSVEAAALLSLPWYVAALAAFAVIAAALFEARSAARGMPQSWAPNLGVPPIVRSRSPAVINPQLAAVISALPDAALLIDP